MRNPGVIVSVDLERIRRNVSAIRESTGVDVYAVVKADGYGVGAASVAEAIKDLVQGWCVFSLAEAAKARLWERTGKRSIAIGPVEAGASVDDHVKEGVRPAVIDIRSAKRLAKADPVICVDTGMQRFACPIERVAEVARAGGCREAFTHATNLGQVRRLVDVGRPLGLRLHASGSSLLGERDAWLDAVRPGIALYRGAIRVSTLLVEVHESKGPVGYTGFAARRHGVIVCGYSNGLRRGVCLVNGERRRIPEVGMQTAYVEVSEADKVGDEVVLLGDELMPEELGKEWGCTPHEALFRLCRLNQPAH
jgi:alanine racemase